MVRDITGLGTGLYLLISQAGAASPNAAVIVAGLTLVSPIAAIYGHAVLSGPSAPSPTQHGEPSSSSPATPPSGQPSSGSSSSSSGAGDGAAP